MRSYSLRYTSVERAGIVHFTAEDAADALIVAHQLARDRSAELWDGNFRVCRIDRKAAEEWRPSWLQG
jgi:hypothetical protein